VSELDLMLTGAWIGDKETSPYQADEDPEVFTWGWHQFEARHARSLLVQAVMDSKYDQVAPALGETFARAADTAIWSGNGTTQPRGISNALRLVGSDGKGMASNLPSWYSQRTGVGKGHALIVEVTEADIDNWRFWCSLTYQKDFNRNYRGKGTLVTSDSMWGNHMQLLQDDNRHPIGRMDPLHDQVALSVAGVGAVKTLPNYVIPDFESAQPGDIIGVYGNLKGYTMNTQPGMPLSTTTWTDHETNTVKTKLLVAMDGRVHDPFGWLFLAKAASA
jgi:HK97 family phage major capsid protein